MQLWIRSVKLAEIAVLFPRSEGLKTLGLRIANRIERLISMTHVATISEDIGRRLYRLKVRQAVLHSIRKPN